MIDMVHVIAAYEYFGEDNSCNWSSLNFRLEVKEMRGGESKKSDVFDNQKSEENRGSARS